MGNGYRCYLLNDDHIVGVEQIDGDDDAAALLEADRVLLASPYNAVEIWKGRRSVGLLSKPMAKH